MIIFKTLGIFNNVFPDTKSTRQINLKKASANDILATINKQNEEGLTFNERLLKYKEFKYLYDKTKIKPVYYFYCLIICLVLVVIGYFENLLTVLIGILYPMYFSIKSLRERNKESIRDWLKYWVVFFLFLNFECVFGIFLQGVSLYFFYKVLFLLVCYLPQYNGAKYFYESFLKSAFKEYEEEMYEISISLANRIKNTLYDNSDEDE
jgi:hypothetical protein